MIDVRQGLTPGVRLLEPEISDIILFALLRVPGHGILTKKCGRLGTSCSQYGGVFQREQFTACFTNYIR